MNHELETPLNKEKLAKLEVGDTVFLSGTIYTARDEAHKKMDMALNSGEKLPFDIRGSAIYYVGPTPKEPGEIIGSAGPTTSGRMDVFTPRFLDLGLSCMIGKGGRSQEVKDSIIKNGAVYLGAIGGAGALMAQSIKECEVIAWPELGCEAVHKLKVEKLPLIVLMDARGRDLYEEGPKEYLNSLNNIKKI